MNEQENMCTLVVLSGVTKVFGAGEQRVNALDHISLTVRSGELLLVMGPSGSGKTTLLSMMAGLAKPTEGIIRLFGRDVVSFSPRELQQLRARRMGFIFQTFLLIDALTVLENVTLAMRFAGHGRREASRLGMDLLARLGMETRARHFPPALSQGEKQRVAAARAMARDTELILADEPTGSLDSQQGFLIIRLLSDHARIENRCVVVVSHDQRLADFADRIVHLEDGRIRSIENGQGSDR